MAGAVLHWDLENAPVPRGVSVSYVLGEMRNAIHARFGVLLSAYAYADPAALSAKRRCELAASGLDIIDCGREAGKLNTVDFRIISRALAELARPVATSTRSAVVVVSGDGDYSYCLSTLRNLAVPTMLIFDSDRRSIVNSTMLQVVEHTVPLSFRGVEEDDNDDGTISAASGACGSTALVPVADTYATSPAMSMATTVEVERIFLQALQLAPAADDDGFRTGTSTGDAFHKLCPSPMDISKAGRVERKKLYQRIKKSLIESGLVETRSDANGDTLMRPAATHQPTPTPTPALGPEEE